MLLTLKFIDSYQSNVQFNVTVLSAVPGSMWNSSQHNILQFLCWFSLHSFYQVATVELWRLEIFWEISMDQTVEINKNNLDCKGLIKICRYSHWQGKISTLLNTTLYNFFGFASIIILTNFFCRVNIFLILSALSPRIIPCFIIEWKWAQ